MLTISYKDETVIFLFEPLIKSTTDSYLEVQIDGEYNKGMTGFYKSNYDGKPIYSTYFEPTYARRAFPCFDQPDMKATFSISINADPEDVVLSNSSLEETMGLIRHFKKTGKMSTYLVTFVVGSLDHIEAKTNGG